MIKKPNPKNTKDSIGRGKKVVMDYHKGTVAHNEHDVASKNVKQKFGSTGPGPKKTAHTKVKKK